MREPLKGGGVLVQLNGRRRLGVEAVPEARHGLVVESVSRHAGGPSGRYELRRREVAGTDLWRVRRV